MINKDVNSNGKQLTYDELNCKANRIANALVNRGVGVEVIFWSCSPVPVTLLLQFLVY